MYSIVLMAALSASSEAPECRRGNRCGGHYSDYHAPVVYVYRPCVIVVPHKPMTKPADKPGVKPPVKPPVKPGEPKKSDLGGSAGTVVASTSTGATVIVRTPAGTTLSVGGMTGRGEGADRRFEMQGLTPGVTYVWTIDATRLVDGKPQTVRQPIEIVAGKVTNVNIEFPASSVAGR